MKIIFMGTPDFAAAPLETIIKSGKHEVTAVVTQPDKPKGRGNAMQFPPVKEMALKYNIPVLQPVHVNDAETIEAMKKDQPDCIVVAAFGQILKEEILKMPKYGCVNIHASLLPKLRGAAPIQWAVINGDKTAGVTTMLMDKGLDTGDMLLKKEIELAPDETGGSLFDRLSECGRELILETLDALEAGTVTPVPQTGESTYAAILQRNSGLIDWTKSAKRIECLIRGMNPWPSAFSYYNGKMVKFWSAKVIETPEGADPEPGHVTILGKHSFCVACGEDSLEMKELQIEGKKRMDADSWLRGVRLNNGDSFTCEK